MARDLRSTCLYIYIHTKDTVACYKQSSQYRPSVETISPTPAASKARTMQGYAFNQSECFLLRSVPAPGRNCIPVSLTPWLFPDFTTILERGILQLGSGKFNTTSILSLLLETSVSRIFYIIISAYKSEI